MDPELVLRDVPAKVPRAAAAPAATQAAATPSPSAVSAAARRSSPGCAPATTPASSSAPPRGTTVTTTSAADHQREDQAGTTDGRLGTASMHPPSVAPRPRRGPRTHHRLDLERAGGALGATTVSRRNGPVSRPEAAQLSTMKHVLRRDDLAVRSPLDGPFGARL